MAKARIVYEVDDKQLDQLQKQLEEIKGQNKEVEESFSGANKEVKKTGGSLSDLKTTVAGLGLAAAAGAAVVEFAKLTQEVNKNRKEVALLTSETGKSLDNITAKLRATSSTFAKDFNEVLRAANTLSKEFGVSLSESIETVNEGFLRGLDVNGDYLDTLREYSFFIKEAGLSQEQFNVLIQKQVTQGIFSDKGIDAIKEAVVSLREMAPATKQAIDGLGISSDKLIQDITNGTKTYFEAVQEITAKTQELGDPTKTGAILADVFRGAGEDAGRFIFTLGDVQNGYSEVTEEQAKYIEKQKELLGVSERLNTELVTFSTNFDGVSTSLSTLAKDIGAAALSVLNDIITGFDGINRAVTEFAATVEKTPTADLQKELAALREEQAKYNQELDNFNSAGFIDKVSLGLNRGIILENRLEAINQKIVLLNAVENQRLSQENAEKQEDLNRKLSVEAKTRQEAAAAAAEQLKQKELEAKIDLETQKSDDDEFQRQTDAFIKNFNTKKDKEGEFTKFLEDENKKRAQSADEYRMNDAISEQEHVDRKKEIIFASVDGFLDILDGFNQLRIQQIDQELQANEMARNRELELAEGNAQRQAQINKKYDEERNKLRTKQVQAQKQQSIFEAVVNTARAIAEALPNVPLSILAGAIGAAQIAFISAQPIPKFAKGVIGLNGPGTDTSDSIPAYLSRNESVMTARETKDYNATLWAIRKKEIKPEILNKFVLEGQKAPVIINDYDRLAEAVMRQPKWNMNMDETGFTLFLQKGINSRTIKQNKFKM